MEIRTNTDGSRYVVLVDENGEEVFIPVVPVVHVEEVAE